MRIKCPYCSRCFSGWASEASQRHIWNCATIGYVESLVEIMKRTLEGGEDVLISGFGKFCVKEKKKRRGWNFHTGESITLNARRVVLFRCSGLLRDKINKKED